MKVLIVAHPDDEIIWFSPQNFDLIVIAFLARHDKPHARYYRKLAIENHPLKERIMLLDIDESGFWKDKSRLTEFKKCQKILYNSLVNIKNQFHLKEIYTHNSVGEYGHNDHILINQLVISIFKDQDIFSPIDEINSSTDTIAVENDLDFYLQVRDVYIKNQAWTWKKDYMPPEILYYSLGRSFK